MAKASKRMTFRQRFDWLKANRAEYVRNQTQWALDAGLGKATVTSQLATMDQRRRTEPEFTRRTWEALAGHARVSLGWLMGMTDSPDGDDIPPVPKVDPAEQARRRLGPGADLLGRLDALEARLSAVEELLSARR